MADVAGMISDIVGVMQNWTNAVNALKAAPEVYKTLLQEYLSCMGVLTNCLGIFQMVREDTIPGTVFQAAASCASLGSELASPKEIKEASTKQRIRLAKVDWDNLKARYERFRSSVKILHDLAQNLLARHLVEGQTQLQDTFDRQTVVQTLLLNQDTARDDRFGSSFGLSGFGSCPFIGMMKDDSSSIQDFFSRSGRHIRPDWHSSVSDATSFTIGQMSMATSVNTQHHFARGIGSRDPGLGIDLSITDSTITVTHEDKPRYISARAKYDTGSEVNFTSSEFVTENGLTPLLNRLEDPEIFVGLNNQEYHVKHTIVLHWCGSRMHKVRTTTFFVADEVPYDILLGNEFILRNRVFDPQRAALALRHKYRHSAQREDDEKQRQQHQALAAQEHQRTRAEDARQRALEREAKKAAKLQTSASSMGSSHLGGQPGSTPSTIKPSLGTSTSIDPIAQRLMTMLTKDLMIRSGTPSIYGS